MIVSNNSMTECSFGDMVVLPFYIIPMSPHFGDVCLPDAISSHGLLHSSNCPHLIFPHMQQLTEKNFTFFAIVLTFILFLTYS